MKNPLKIVKQARVLHHHRRLGIGFIIIKKGIKIWKKWIIIVGIKINMILKVNNRFHQRKNQINHRINQIKLINARRIGLAMETII